MEYWVVTYLAVVVLVGSVVIGALIARTIKHASKPWKGRVLLCAAGRIDIEPSDNSWELEVWPSQCTLVFEGAQNNPTWDVRFFIDGQRRECLPGCLGMGVQYSVRTADLEPGQTLGVRAWDGKKQHVYIVYTVSVSTRTSASRPRPIVHRNPLAISSPMAGGNSPADR